MFETIENLMVNHFINNSVLNNEEVIECSSLCS